MLMVIDLLGPVSADTVRAKRVTHIKDISIMARILPAVTLLLLLKALIKSPPVILHPNYNIRPLFAILIKNIL